VDLIQHEPAVGGFKITTSSTAAAAEDQQQQQQVLYARKVVLATGIQVRLRCVIVMLMTLGFGSGYQQQS
jgi:hypothetical protein